MDAQNLLYLILLVVSLLVSAFFAGSETALVALGRIDLARLRESGDPRAAILRGLKAHTSRLLATILIGQNRREQAGRVRLQAAQDCRARIAALSQTGQVDSPERDERRLRTREEGGNEKRHHQQDEIEKILSVHWESLSARDGGGGKKD